MNLPERVLSCWNFQGDVDNYSSRFWGAFAVPLMNIGIYLFRDEFKAKLLHLQLNNIKFPYGSNCNS
ncbi:MAG: DUF1648 domain-containing protein [Clostridiales bacterium]|nr:DUF1648 domain-containing protein [Clostridiales bacterium]MCF8023009.1 DUF1648 domain-containing protein [Clostridiales bacterium]